jgi:DNA-binding MarR family transcriptional regulator
MNARPSARFVVDQAGGHIALDLFVLQQHLGMVLDSALAATGVTASAYAVYGQLAQGAVTPGRLSETLGIRPTTLSGYLATMERSGHVTRVRNERDGRSWVLELTEPGRAKAEECRQVVGQVVRSLNAGIGTAEDVREVREMLARLDRAVVAAFARP